MTNLIQQTLDDSSLDPRTRRLLDARAKAFESELYLGDPSKEFQTHGMWKRIGHGNYLVTKVSADAAEKAQQTAEASSNPPDDSAGLEPLLLSAIVLIDRDDCWVAPDGNWKSDNRFTPKFEDLKMTFTGKAPPSTLLEGQLAEDFSQSIEGAKQLIRDIAVKPCPSLNFVIKAKDGSDGLKFRHIVFEKLSGDIGNGSDTASDSDESWTMADWPCMTNDAKAARDQMIGTHQPVPLPAYDITGELIQPDQCQKSLAGAVARVTFKLIHYFIDKSDNNGSAKNLFVADIQAIRILVDPPQQVMSPKKRKTARRDPGGGSPPKRLHIGSN